MSDGYVDIQIPGEAFARRGRLLAEAEASGPLPLLQVYDSFEYLLVAKRHSDGRVEHEEVWLSDDQCDGRCQPVTRRTKEEVAVDLRRFFGDEPRTEELVREASAGWTGIRGL